ncbi:MAG: DUF763 domain-containing protein [candidate division WOR-3 bacterium]
MRIGLAELPLHWGSAPRWLFERMTRLARAIAEIIVIEYGPEEFLKRISDPVWFQSLGCVLGFDWHSSGVTTTVCGALKEGLKENESELGIFIAGGKGKTSRKTPEEIAIKTQKFGLDPKPLVYASRMSAKVDSACLQDGYQIYHHTFISTKDGKWAVVQQGMNPQTHWARRYHWLSSAIDDFVVEPHKAIVCDHKTKPLNLVAKESEDTRIVSVKLAQEKPEKTIKELKRIKELVLPKHHPIFASDINPKRIEKILLTTYENPPKDFAELVIKPGVGPKTLRALALISEIAYGAKPSFSDPVSYTFAHGGKDGHPYPVNKTEYDRSIAILERAIKLAKIGRTEQLSALRRLANWQKIADGY